MNIYFACSITGGREFESVYQAITQALAEDYHEVPTAHLAESSVTEVEAVIGPLEVYSRDVAWIRACDLLIAEVSAPSHGVGYEIGFALALGKPVLALYQEGRKVSKMISGNPDPNLTFQTYMNAEQAVALIRTYLTAILIREKRH
jgi:nucleoside 2-deoxyribosyltransferase